MIQGYFQALLFLYTFCVRLFSWRFLVTISTLAFTVSVSRYKSSFRILTSYMTFDTWNFSFRSLFLLKFLSIVQFVLHLNTLASEWLLIHIGSSEDSGHVAVEVITISFAGIISSSKKGKASLEDSGSFCCPVVWLDGTLSFCNEDPVLLTDRL